MRISDRAKAAALALLLALVMGFAMAMPLTLHLRLPDRVEFVARHFCPETGVMAQRYYSPRSSRRSLQVACLDSNGDRIEDSATHGYIVRTIGFAWSAALWLLFYSIFAPLFVTGRGFTVASAPTVRRGWPPTSRR